MKNNDLEKRVGILEAELAALKMTLELAGIPSIAWTSVRCTAQLCGISQNSVLQELHIAEALRAEGSEGYLVYGEDYKSNACTNGKVTNTLYKINAKNFYNKVVRVPPDERRYNLGLNAAQIVDLIGRHKLQ